MLVRFDGPAVRRRRLVGQPDVVEPVHHDGDAAFRGQKHRLVCPDVLFFVPGRLVLYFLVPCLVRHAVRPLRPFGKCGQQTAAQQHQHDAQCCGAQCQPPPFQSIPHTTALLHSRSRRGCRPLRYQDTVYRTRRMSLRASAKNFTHEKTAAGVFRLRQRSAVSEFSVFRCGWWLPCSARRGRNIPSAQCNSRSGGRTPPGWRRRARSSSTRTSGCTLQ